MRLCALVLFAATACGPEQPAAPEDGGSDVSTFDGGPDAGNGVVDAGAPTGCPRVSERVGWSAALATRFHGVAGRVTMTDACTLTVTGFSYDGQGIDVRLTGAAAGQGFARGVALGPQLFRPRQPWVNETLVIPLPADVSLEQLDAVSVWCIAASVDFGSGTFSP